MEVIREGLSMELPDGLKLERDSFGKLCETDNKKEGVAAFLEKRKPETRDS